MLSLTIIALFYIQINHTMKKVIIAAVSILLFSSCSENNEYIKKIKERISSDAMGIDLKYKSLEFKMIDTISIKEYTDSLLLPVIEFKEQVSKDSNFLIDNRSSGRIEALIAKVKRTAEISDRLYGSNSNMIEYQLCQDKWNKTNKDLSTVSSQYEFWKLVVYCYEARSKIHNISTTAYDNLNDLIFEAEKSQSKIDSISKFTGDKPVYFKAFNKYTIVNPVFGNATQTINSVFTFDENKKLIDRIDSF